MLNMEVHVDVKPSGLHICSWSWGSHPSLRHCNSVQSQSCFYHRHGGHQIFTARRPGGNTGPGKERQWLAQETGWSFAGAAGMRPQDNSIKALSWVTLAVSQVLL